MNRLKRKQIDRPRAFWGALISTGVGIANALINSSTKRNNVNFKLILKIIIIVFEKFKV